MTDKLAIFGGPESVTVKEPDAFGWPVYEKEDLETVKLVMSEDDYKFYEEAYCLEQEIKEFFEIDYALPMVNGTAALHSALYALGIGYGDEVIVPSYTYWATVMPVLICNGTPVFAESDPETLNIDPRDIERRITPKTKAIIVVHLCGLPCEMEPVMEIANKHGLKVIEDCAHCIDAEYKGRITGTIGDIGCFSYQATKLIPGIEGGMLITGNRKYYEKAVALGHYERLSGLPPVSRFRKYQHTCFGYKYRINPLSAAIVRIQLQKYERINRQRVENLEYLDSELDTIKGIGVIRTPSHMKRNYYCYRLIYKPEELGGLEIEKFIAALQAEGLETGLERYVLMHKQPVFNERNSLFPWSCKDDKLPGKASLPVTEKLYERVFTLPTFTRASKKMVTRYVEGIKKVVAHADELKESLKVKIRDIPDMDWSGFSHKVLR
jgi:dTDP-4-amino-4,6-dideoxygalactose transaminase